MEREPGSFDWGFGAGPQPTGTPGDSSPTPPVSRPSQYPSATPQRPVQVEQRAQQSWDDPVSFDPNDLGFQATDIPRRSVGRRLIGPIIALVIIGGLAVGGTIVIDDFARGAVEGVISEKVASTFGITDEDSISVDLGPGIFIGQAFTGSIDDVSVTVPEAVFEPFTGTVALSAQGVPTSPSRPTKQLAITLDLSGEQATAFAAAFKSGSKSEVTLGAGTITVSTSVSKIPVLVAYAPSAVEGALVLTPTTITVDGDEYTVDEFAKTPYAAKGKKLMEARTLCVADKLPAAMTFTGLDVTTDAIEIAASGKGVPLVGGGLTTRGTCETE